MLAELDPDELHVHWDFQDVCAAIESATAETRNCRAALMNTNLLEPICTLVAEYLGSGYLPTRNPLSGAEARVPASLQLVTKVLRRDFVDHCARNTVDYPTPLSIKTKQVLNEALYFWVGFLRIPNQECGFTKCGVDIWLESRKPRMPARG